MKAMIEILKSPKRDSFVFFFSNDTTKGVAYLEDGVLNPRFQRFVVLTRENGRTEAKKMDEYELEDILTSANKYYMFQSETPDWRHVFDGEYRTVILLKKCLPEVLVSGTLPSDYSEWFGHLVIFHDETTLF